MMEALLHPEENIWVCSKRAQSQVLGPTFDASINRQLNVPPVAYLIKVIIGKPPLEGGRDSNVFLLMNEREMIS